MYNYQDDEVTELRKEVERLRTGNRLHLELAEIKESEIKRLREVLQKIADLEYEDLPAPKSANETVLWVCLDRCITFAETALKEKE